MSDNPVVMQNSLPSLTDMDGLQHKVADLENQVKEYQLFIQFLQEQTEYTQFLLDESSDPIFSFLPDGTYLYVNKVFAQKFGKDVDEIIGRRVWDFFQQREAAERFTAIKWVLEHAEQRSIEMHMPDEYGGGFYITTAKPILDDQGKVKSVLCISKDITEHKQMEEELLRLSTHDVLTGLHNRNFFETKLMFFQKDRHYPVSVVMADVDGLKIVNDVQGHEEGDNLLRRTAGVLQQIFRNGDVVARIGGDEFAVILPGTAEAPAFDVVKRLNEALDKENPPIRLSIGVATEWEGCTMMELLNLADKRMYEEKRRRKSC